MMFSLSALVLFSAAKGIFAKPTTRATSNNCDFEQAYWNETGLPGVDSDFCSIRTIGFGSLVKSDFPLLQINGEKAIFPYGLASITDYASQPRKFLKFNSLKFGCFDNRGAKSLSEIANNDLWRDKLMTLLHNIEEKYGSSTKLAVACNITFYAYDSNGDEVEPTEGFQCQFKPKNAVLGIGTEPVGLQECNDFPDTWGQVKELEIGFPYPILDEEVDEYPIRRLVAAFDDIVVTKTDGKACS